MIRGMSGPEYVVHARFRAPLEFVYRWCTDFSSEDAKLEGESYTRRVLARSPKEVVYEDLEETDSGWDWKRTTVELRPPKAWRSLSVGNYRTVRAEYLLTADGDERTTLELRWRRIPGPLPSRVMSKRARETQTDRAWKVFAKSLERDYQARSKKPRRRR